MTHTRHDDLAWNAMSIQDVLELAIADEEEARDYYRRAAAMTGNAHTQRVLMSLADMEQGHAETLRRELEDLTMQKELETGIAD